MRKIHGILHVRVLFGEREVERLVFDQESVTIGRAPGNDVRLDNPAVSARHARIVRRPAGYVLEDLDSTNGTLLNGRKIASEVLVGAPRIAVGKHLLELRVEGESDGVGRAPASTPMAGAEATVFLGVAGVAALQTPAASPSRPAGRLEVERGRAAPEALTLKGETALVGKAATAAMRLQGLLMPDVAFLVEPEADGFTLVPGRSGKVTVNGAKVFGRRKLRSGDLIAVGGTELRYRQAGR